jgi:hypothetical protein
MTKQKSKVTLVVKPHADNVPAKPQQAEVVVTTKPQQEVQARSQPVS